MIFCHFKNLILLPHLKMFNTLGRMAKISRQCVEKPLPIPQTWLPGSAKHLSKDSSKTEENNKMPSVNGSLVLKYTKVIPEAYPPTKGSLKAAGYDLKSAHDVNVPARGKALVDTGIKIQLPEGCYGRIAPRSGLAVKNFIDVGAGVVDEDYRGVLKVVLFNHSDADFEVKSGDRIAQLICERIYYPEIEEVQDLTDTERGEGGFGSTGTK